MAFAYIEAVYRLPDLTASECAVLAYLANRADHRGECWPARSTIAEAVRLHPDTVKAILQGLAARQLIRKEERTYGGRRIANRIVMNFDPVKDAPVSGGSVPPTHGVCDPPLNSPQGGKDGEGRGVTDPLEREPPEEPSVEDSLAGWARSMFAEGAAIQRKRSSVAQVDTALRAAVRRGADPARLAEALRRYRVDPDIVGKDGTKLAGVHRVIQNDVWRSWDPGPGDYPGPAASGPVGGPAAAAPPPMVKTITLDEFRDPVFIPPGALDGIIVGDHLDAQRVLAAARREVSRISDWMRNPATWRSAEWGPPPGAEGCRAWPDVLEKLGALS